MAECGSSENQSGSIVPGVLKFSDKILRAARHKGTAVTSSQQNKRSLQYLNVLDSTTVYFRLYLSRVLEIIKN